MKEAFDCQKCGHCCEGEGGIIVSPTDLTRILEHLKMSAEEFTEKYGEVKDGKLRIRVGEDNYCIFFVQGKGCGVHTAKPNICRAWPYFRGNVIDSESWEMAKDFCPGIRRDVSHDEFAQQGRAYLRDNNLLASDKSCEARALILDDE